MKAAISKREKDMARRALVRAFLAGDDAAEIAAKMILRRYVRQVGDAVQRKPQRCGRPVCA